MRRRKPINKVLVSNHAVRRFRERVKIDATDEHFKAAAVSMAHNGVEVGGQYGRDKRAILATHRRTGTELVVMLKHDRDRDAWIVTTVLTRDLAYANIYAVNKGRLRA